MYLIPGLPLFIQKEMKKGVLHDSKQFMSIEYLHPFLNPCLAGYVDITLNAFFLFIS